MVTPPIGVPAAGALPPIPPPPPEVLRRYPDAGRHPRGPTTTTWLASIITRNPLGSFWTIFCAWFNLPFVLMMAGIGAFFGGLGGVVSGTFAGQTVPARIDTFFKWIFPLPVTTQDLLPIAAVQIGGIVGGILGAFNGAFELAWRAFVWPWQALYAGDPTWPVTLVVGQVVTALFVGFLTVGGYALLEPVILYVAGCRRPSRREAEWLLPQVYEIGMRMGLRQLPKVLVHDSMVPNASSHVRHIVINRGLLEEFSFDRYTICGVIAHELGHWKEGDSIQRAWTVGVGLPLIVLFEIFYRLTHLRTMKVDGSGPERAGGVVVNVVVQTVRLISYLLGWSVLVTTRYIMAPVLSATWRAQEYRADELARAAGYGDGIYAAFARLRRAFDGGRSGFAETIMASHPPLELRMERLERPGRTYVLPDRHALSQLLPGWAPYSSIDQE